MTPARAALAPVLALALAACSAGEDDRRVTELARADEAVSEELMVALGQAKNFHHKADVYLSDGKPQLAERALRRVLDVRFPEDSPEGADVRLDARARLAKLLVSRGATDEAMAVVEGGLEHTRRESFFVANLYTVKGEILEARAAALEAGGGADADGGPAAPGRGAAAALRARALDAYDRSIAINERLQKQLMGEVTR